VPLRHNKTLSLHNPVSSVCASTDSLKGDVEQLTRTFVMIPQILPAIYVDQLYRYWTTACHPPAGRACAITVSHWRLSNWKRKRISTGSNERRTTHAAGAFSLCDFVCRRCLQALGLSQWLVLRGPRDERGTGRLGGVTRHNGNT